MPEAAFNLGISYQRGQGVTADEMEAFKWLEIAANSGLARAQYELAVCYQRGLGTVVDLAEACRWSGLAAERGSQPARELKEELEKEMAAIEAGKEEAQQLS